MNFFRIRIIVLFLLITGGIMNSGCGNWAIGSYQAESNQKKSMPSVLASNAYQYEGPERNPVIIVHGFLGAKIFDDSSNREIWGKFSPGGMPESDYQAFAHPMKIGVPLSALRNDTVDRQMLDVADVRVLGFEFTLPGYNRLTELLEKAGYVHESTPLPPNRFVHTIYEFHYDWRRDLVENARRLHEFILTKRQRLQEQYKKYYNVDNYDVQFDIVGHSMGGLISRYYLMFGDQDLPGEGGIPSPSWAGSKYVDKLFVVGTPNAGYLDTVSELANGLQMAPGTPYYPSGVIATFPAYYFMLPEQVGGEVFGSDKPGEALDMFDFSVWEKYNLGLLNPDNDKILAKLLPEADTPEARRAIAKEHLQKCLKRARLFRNAINQNVEKNPSKSKMYLFVGDSTPTSLHALLTPDGKISITQYGAGDGKVLTSSGRLDERRKAPYFFSPIPWDKIYFNQASHMGILNSDDFAPNFRFQLLMNPTSSQKDRVMRNNYR